MYLLLNLYASIVQSINKRRRIPIRYNFSGKIQKIHRKKLLLLKHNNRSLKGRVSMKSKKKIIKIKIHLNNLIIFNDIRYKNFFVNQGNTPVFQLTYSVRVPSHFGTCTSISSILSLLRPQFFRQHMHSHGYECK